MSLLGNKPTKKRPPTDYHEKILENPFYKRRDRIISFAGLKGKLIIIACAAFLILTIWFIFISNFWVITKISISGTDQMSNDDINNLISQQMHSNNYIFLPQGNLLFFNENKFKQNLLKKYHFQSVVIKKQWPSGINIAIINKPIAGIWKEGDKYFYADTDGYAVQEISPLNIKDNKYPLIFNESQLKMYNGRITVDPNYLNFITSLYQKYAIAMPGSNVDHFTISNNTDSVDVLTTDGLKIIFNTRDDVSKQLSNLSILKNQKLKDDFAKQKMIDLRFGDKIYYQ
jgi:cell division septal protein FtsQ